jgi:hypothetical protein
MTEDGDERGDERGDFIYRGEEMADVPRDVISVKVRPTVKVIKHRAFSSYLPLNIANLGVRLEEIGGEAFWDCISYMRFRYPPPSRQYRKGHYGIARS